MSLLKWLRSSPVLTAAASLLENHGDIVNDSVITPLQIASSSMKRKKPSTQGNIKSSISKKTTRVTKSSTSSYQATSGKGTRGFWSLSKAEQSKRLWLPTRIRLPALRPKSSSGSSIQLVADSSFRAAITNARNKNSVRTSWQSSTYSIAGLPVKRESRVKKRKDLPPAVNRCRHYPLALTQRQHALMKRMFMDCRKTYNIALQYVLKMGWHRKEYLLNDFNKFEMRTLLQKMFVSDEGIFKHRTWHRLLRTPKVPRQQAVYSLVDVLDAQQTKLEKRLELAKKYPDALYFQRKLKFNPKFKSKRGWVSDSIYIEKTSFQLLCERSFSLYKDVDIRQSKVVSRTGFYKKREEANKRKKEEDLKKRETEKSKKDEEKKQNGGKSKQKTAEERAADKKRVEDKKREDKEQKENKYVFRQIKIQKGVLPNDVFARDPRICFQHGRFTLMESRTIEVDGRQQVRCMDKERMCALDPGVRKFLTGYSPEGSGFIIGCNTTKVLDKCIQRIDRTKKKYTDAIVRAKTLKTKKAKRLLWGYRAIYHDAETKAKHVVRDLHYKASHFLCQSFDTILYPNFNAHDIAQGPLNKMVKRRLNMLSFYQFSERLKQTATFYPSVVIKRGSEAYTSKQCGGCGVLNDKLGGSEVFKCKECGLTADRDMHAARNILLRHLS